MLGTEVGGWVRAGGFASSELNLSAAKPMPDVTSSESPFFAGNTAPSGLCSPGHFCLQGAYNATPTDSSTGDVCPAGRYCLEGSSVGTHCPVGTFSNRQGLQNSSECDACTPGYYCGQTGLTAESGTCWAGGLIFFPGRLGLERGVAEVLMDQAN